MEKYRVDDITLVPSPKFYFNEQKDFDYLKTDFGIQLPMIWLFKNIVDQFCFKHHNYQYNIVSLLFIIAFNKLTKLILESCESYLEEFIIEKDENLSTKRITKLLIAKDLTLVKCFSLFYMNFPNNIIY